MPRQARFALSQADMAAIVGRSLTTIRKHIHAGCPVPRCRSRILRWVRSYHAWCARNGKASSDSREPDSETRQVAIELNGLRSQLMQLELDNRRSRLIERQAVIDYCESAVRALRARLQTIRRRLSSRLENCTADEVDSAIRIEFDAMCDDFAEGMTGHDPGRPNGKHENPAAPERPAAASQPRQDDER